MTETEVPNVEENWVAASRKRRKVREKEQIRGVKLRKSSSDKKSIPLQGQDELNVSDNVPKVNAKFKLVNHDKDEDTASKANSSAKSNVNNAIVSKPATAAKAKQTPLLGLGDYSSDDSM